MLQWRASPSRLPAPRLISQNLAKKNQLSRWQWSLPASGAKLWMFSHSRPFTKKRANLGLGGFSDLPLAGPRVKAQKFNALLAKDIAPKEHRIEQARKDDKAHTNTFEHVATKWLKLKESKVSQSYYKKISSRLNLHVFLSLGKLPLYKVNAVDTTLRTAFADGKLLKEGENWFFALPL